MAKKSSEIFPHDDPRVENNVPSKPLLPPETATSPANGPAAATLAEPARGVPGIGKQVLPDLAEVARQHVLNTTATVATPRDEIAAPRASQTPSQRPRGMDVELQTMARIDKMLVELEDDPRAGLPAVGRVLDWIKSRWQTRPCTEKTDINVSQR